MHAIQMGGVAVLEGKLEKNFEEEIVRDLTFQKLNVIEQKRETYRCYAIRKGRNPGESLVIVPRMYPVMKQLSREFKVSTGKPLSMYGFFSLKRSLGWVGAPEQPRFVREIVEKSLVNRMGGIGIADCGTGKTLMGLEVIMRLASTALVVVPLTHLIERWQEEAHDSYTLEGKPLELGVFQGPRRDNTRRFPIVIATMQSLAKESDPRYFEQFGVTIFDECHHMPADTLASRILPKLRSQYVFGLTAELYRSDKLHKPFFYLLGDVLSEIKTERKDKGRTIQIWSEFPVEIETWQKHKMQVSQVLARTDRRTQAISWLIHTLYINSDRQIFVFSDIRDHLQRFYDVLCNNIPESDLGFFIGGDAEETSLKKRITMVTYSMGREALNAPHKDTLICATPPPSNITQLSGRITRKLLDKEKNFPLAIDIVDVTDKKQRKFGELRERKWCDVGFDMFYSNWRVIFDGGLQKLLSEESRENFSQEEAKV